MDTRVAVISIIVEDKNTVPALNELLHEYADYIIGRMGIPHTSRGVSLISVAMDGPQDSIAALSGKIGALAGVKCKTAYSDIN